MRCTRSFARSARAGGQLSRAGADRRSCGGHDRWVRYYGKNGRRAAPALQFPPDVAALVREGDARRPWTKWRRPCPPLPGRIMCLGNHDQPRLATRFGGQEQARLAGMLLLTLRGTPTVYYGDEMGMENGVIPPEKIQDPQGINLGAERTRDVARTPMQWDAAPMPVSHR